jgi:hypothetical protein
MERQPKSTLISTHSSVKSFLLCLHISKLGGEHHCKTQTVIVFAPCTHEIKSDSYSGSVDGGHSDGGPNTNDGHDTTGRSGGGSDNGTEPGNGKCTSSPGNPAGGGGDRSKNK